MTFNDTHLADGILMFDFDVAKIERRDVLIHIEFNVVDDADIVSNICRLDSIKETITCLIRRTVPMNYFYDPSMSPSDFHLWQKTDIYKYSDLGRLYTTKQAPRVIGEFTYHITGSPSRVDKYYGTIRAKVIYPIYFEGKPTFVEGFYKFNGITRKLEVAQYISI